MHMSVYHVSFNIFQWVNHALKNNKEFNYDDTYKMIGKKKEAYKYLFYKLWYQWKMKYRKSTINSPEQSSSPFLCL